MAARNNDLFRRCANATSRSMGSPWAFSLAVLVVLVWLATGPLFHFSDTWQLVINTGTTIITFLMVFLIQNTQNRDAVAMHLKLDELIRAMRGARNRMVDLEELSDEELHLLQEEFRKLGAEDPSGTRARRHSRRQRPGAAANEPTLAAKTVTHNEVPAEEAARAPSQQPVQITPSAAAPDQSRGGRP